MHRHRYVSPIDISRDLSVIILCLLRNLNHPTDISSIWSSFKWIRYKYSIYKHKKFVF